MTDSKPTAPTVSTAVNSPSATTLSSASSGGPAQTTATEILEVALLEVRPDDGDAYEAAFREAQQYIAASPGYIRHELRRRTEAPGRYILLVWWDSVESHMQGFRESDRYAPWRELLHGFYDPFPTVEHFERVTGAAGFSEAAREEA